MKAKLKRVMPVVLVVIFFMIALVAQHLPISLANAPFVPNPIVPFDGPNVTVSNNEGVFSINGVTNLMEYKVGITTPFEEWQWTECPEGVLQASQECDVFIRYKGDEDTYNIRFLPLRNNYAVTLSWEATSEEKSISVKCDKLTIIEWGDGYAEFIEASDEIQQLTHIYYEAGSYEVRIADNVITYVDCNDSNVSALNVKYNTKLIELHCSNNSISELNLSKNVALENLYCNNNNLLSLDLNNNAALARVSCVQADSLETVTVIASQFTSDVRKTVTEGLDSISESKALYKHENTVINEVTLIIPSTPNVTVVKNEDGTYRLENIDNTMEYNAQDPAYGGEWTTWSEGELQAIKFNSKYYVRVKSVENVSITSLPQTVEVKVVKLETATKEDGSQYASITGMTTEMEYNDVSVDYTEAWTTWTEGALAEITDNVTYHIRMIGTTSPVVSYTVNVIERADAPNISYAYNADGSCYLVGMDETMEYNAISWDYAEAWTKYTEDVPLNNITEDITYYVRVAATETSPSSKIRAVAVNVIKKANVSIVSNGDGSYKIAGMTTEMEYNTESPTYEGTWTIWEEGTLQKITESISYYVRIKGETAVTALNVYVIIKSENEDRSYDILGVTEKMEYSEDQTNWKPYTAGALDNINADKTIYVRVKENGIAPAGQIVTITIRIRPAAPVVTSQDNGDGTYSLVGMTTEMEYNTESATYTGTWTKYVEGTLKSETESKTYYIRIAATGETPEGRVLELPVNVVSIPAAPNVEAVQDETTGVVSIIGMTTAMEYNTIAVDYDGEWTRYVEEDPLNNITSSVIYYVRYAADGETPVSAVKTLNIVFKYVITATAGENGSITPNGEIEITEGEDKTFTITPDEGYEVEDVLVNGESVGAVKTYTVDDIKENITIYATFKEETCAIEFTWDTTGQLEKSITLTYTSNITIDWGGAPASGEKFYDTVIMPMGVSQITDTFSYTYETEGSFTVRIYEDAVNGLTCPEMKISSLDVSGATTLEALYCYENKITALDLSECENISKVCCVQEDAMTLYLTDVQKANITVTDETTGCNDIATADTIHKGANTVIFENITVLPNITVVDNGDGTVKLEGMTTALEYNTESETYAGTWTKYVEGALDSISADAIYYIRIAATETSSASRVVEIGIEFIPITVTVGENGTVTPSENVKALVGGKRTFTFTPNEGYEVEDVKVNGVSKGAVSSYTFESVSGNPTIEVSFKLKTYTISYDVNEGVGEFTSQEKTHGVDLTLDINVPTREGYKFLGWATTKDATEGEYEAGVAATFTTDADTTLYAIWKEKATYTITIEPDENGSISFDGDLSVLEGGEKTFSIVPDEGYEVEDVKVNGISVGAVTSHTITDIKENITISAIFIKAYEFIENEYLKSYDISEEVSKILIGDTWYILADDAKIYANTIEQTSESINANIALVEIFNQLGIEIEENIYKNYSKVIKVNARLNSEGKVIRVDLFVSGTYISEKLKTIEGIVAKIRNEKITIQYTQGSEIKEIIYDISALEEDEILTIIKDGAIASVDDIEVGNVLTCYYGTTIEDIDVIYVSENVVEGKVTRANKTDLSVYIENVAYTPSMGKVFITNDKITNAYNVEDSNVLVDEFVELYLNDYGEYVLAVIKTFEFGYIKTIGNFELLDADEDIYGAQIRMLLPDGTSSSAYTIIADAFRLSDAEMYLADKTGFVAFKCFGETIDWKDIIFIDIATGNLEAYTDGVAILGEFADIYEVITTLVEGNAVDYENKKIYDNVDANAEGVKTYQFLTNSVVYNANPDKLGVYTKWDILVKPEEDSKKLNANTLVIVEKGKTDILYAIIDVESILPSDAMYAVVVDDHTKVYEDNEYRYYLELIDEENAEGKRIYAERYDEAEAEVMAIEIDSFVEYILADDEITTIRELVQLIKFDDLGKDDAVTEDVIGEGVETKLAVTLVAGDEAAGTTGTVKSNFKVIETDTDLIKYEDEVESSFGELEIDENVIIYNLSDGFEIITFEELDSAVSIGDVYVIPYANKKIAEGTDANILLAIGVEPEAFKYTISYDANEGENAPASQEKTKGVDLQLTTDVPTRDGYVFLGWATNKDATEAEYEAGGAATFTTDADTVLYAVWKQEGTIEESYAIEFVWSPSNEETEGVSQLNKGIRLIAAAETTIDWGDGTQTPVTTSQNFYKHTYTVAGEYTVKIKDDVIESLDFTRGVTDGELAAQGGDALCANPIISVDLSNATVLKTLHFWHNELSELDVSFNTNLVSLCCHSNKLTSLDLSNNINLTELILAYNSLVNIDLSKNVNLTSLRVEDNSLTELNLSKNTKLSELWCYNNNLTKLDVSNNEKLSELYCSNNNLDELDIRKNTKINSICAIQETLGTIYLTEDQKANLTIEDIDNDCFYSPANTLHKHANTNILIKPDAIKFVWSPTNDNTYGISQLKKKIWVSVNSGTTTVINWGDGTSSVVTDEVVEYEHEYSEAGEYTVKIQDDVVRSLRLTRTVNNGELVNGEGTICNNQITQLNINKCTNLEALVCEKNELAALDVNNNLKLYYLLCAGNKLTDLDVSNNTLLETLDCSFNKLIELNISNNNYLEQLSCYGNDLYELDVTNNLLLQYLYCFNNNLDELDLINNEELEVLSCNNNNLIELDLSKNTALKTLSCADNYIAELDLTQNIVISSVCAVQESLKSIYLTNAQKDKLAIENKAEGCYFPEENKMHKHSKTEILQGAPDVYAVNNGDETYRIEGLDRSMEYNRVSLTYGGKWTRYSAGALQNIDETITYYIRFAKTENEPASVAKAVHITPNAFIVTINAGKNGEVYPSGNVIVPKGESQEIIITPKPGYKVSKVLVNGEDVGSVASYLLENINETYNVEVIFRKKLTASIVNGSGYYGGAVPQGIIKPVWKNKFTDVIKGEWYYSVIEYVNERKYFSGTSETTFSPNDPMTREMFMAALYNMDRNPITYGPNNYFDVEPGRWSEAAIVWGSAKGLISGLPDGSFKPEEPVTREQVATILKKYAEYDLKYPIAREDLSSFNDYTEVSDWAYDSISWAVAKGVMKGDANKYVLPLKSATRAEVAAMFMNYDKMD